MNAWKVILATILIFGAGVLTGGLLVHHAIGTPVRRPFSQRPGPAGSHSFAGLPGGLKFDFLRRMQGDLKLTPEQREHAQRIFTESQERARKIIRPVVAEESEHVRKEFRELLTPEQRERFDLLWSQQHSHDPHHSAPPREATVKEAPAPQN